MRCTQITRLELGSCAHLHKPPALCCAQVFSLQNSPSSNWNHHPWLVLSLDYLLPLSWKSHLKTLDMVVKFSSPLAEAFAPVTFSCISTEVTTVNYLLPRMSEMDCGISPKDMNSTLTLANFHPSKGENGLVWAEIKIPHHIFKVGSLLTV